MGAVPPLRLVRYAGLVGAALVAVAAHLGGALRGFEPGVTPAGIWRGEHGPWIVSAWVAGLALMTGAWWVVRDRVPSARWAYLTAGLWLLPLLVTPPLASRDVYSYACQGAVYAAGENPYRVSAADLPCQWLDTISPIWRDTPAPYGPLFVVIAGAAAAIGGSLGVTIALLRAVAVAGVGLAAASLPVLARRCGVPPRRALWLVLACPLVGVHLVAGAHNDAPMIGLLIAGLAVLPAAHAPRSWLRLAGGGALIGLSVAVKATALVVLPFAALAAIAGPYRLRALVRDGGPVVGGALAAVLAATLGSGLGFGWVGALSHSGDSVQWTSPSTAVGLAIGYAGRLFGADVRVVPGVRLVGLAALLVVLVVLWLRARSGDPLRAAGTALVATLALGPVFHAWYAILPLAVVAATGVAARWALGACAAASFLVMPDGSGLAGSTRFPGALAMTALVLALGVRWARRACRERSSSAVRPSDGSPSEERPGASLPSQGTLG
jgi:alpha-1,6-mannosyltransferase